MNVSSQHMTDVTKEEMEKARQRYMAGARQQRYRAKKVKENPDYYRDQHARYKDNRNGYSKQWHKNKMLENPDYYKEIYAKNQDKLIERARANRLKNRMLVIKAYGGKCSCCGEDRHEFLAIDHMDGSGNEHRRSIGGAPAFYPWLIKNNFPSGFRVLCHNCNLSFGFFGYCPHQKEL